MSTDDAAATGPGSPGPSPGPGSASAGRPTGDDRRRFPRLSRSCRIRVRPLSGIESASDAVDAVTVNISGGGLCYEGSEPLALGGFVAVELAMDELESPVLALARTAFCAPLETAYEIGLEFWWVGWGDDSAQRAISELIKTELRQQGPG